MSKLTGVHSEVAAYEFTTLTCIPGTIHHKDTKIQLLDLPGIIEGASMGRGRGRQVIAVAKSSDCILMVIPLFMIFVLAFPLCHYYYCFYCFFTFKTAGA
jgi:ribosome-interacting GTPase 1